MSVSAPRTLDVPTDPASFSLTRQETVDERSVSIGLTLSAQSRLRAPATGRLTGFDCRVGAEMSNGHVIGSIDGANLVVLSSAMPPWRDLRAGDAGDDVLAVQVALASLGYDIIADGKLGARSIAAFQELLGTDEASAPKEIRAASIVWLPFEGATISACATETGALVSNGEVIASLDPRLEAAAVVEMPADLVDGSRVVRIDEATLPIRSDGTIDSASLGSLERTASYRMAIASSAGDGTSIGGGNAASGGSQGSANTAAGRPKLDAKLVLAQPIPSWGVPPGTLTEVNGDRACVWSAGKSYAVRVIGSQLGKSYIAFEPGVEAPSAIDMRPPEGATCESG